jgi:hypothetical protein
MGRAVCGPATKLRLRRGVLCQRDISLFPYSDISSALHDARFSRPGPDEAMIMVARRGKRYELNLVAAFVWENIDGERTIDDLAEMLVAHFAVDTTRARSDLESLGNQLLELDLIERDDGAG